jgi:hypothetical protein
MLSTIPQQDAGYLDQPQVVGGLLTHVIVLLTASTTDRKEVFLFVAQDL